MSRRKGVSAEEKRTRLLQLFYEKKDVYQLKELEKIAPKEKGIVSQSVKEVLQSLVDDGLIDSEKIGTSVYFWAFPSKAMNIRSTKLSDLKSKMREAESKSNALKEQIASAKVGREDSERRACVLREIAQKEQRLSELKAELQEYRENDPEVLEELRKEADVARDSANRWTDNVFAIKSFCKQKFFIEESQLDKQFDIPEDFDYIE